MDRLVEWSGYAGGIAGLLLCVAAAILRLGGHYYIGGMQVITLLQAGTAALAAGCFLLMAGRGRRSQG